VAPVCFERGTILQVTTVDHPLAQHYLTILRDRTTEPEQFRETTRRLAYTLVMEATRDAETAQVSIETPLEATSGTRIDKDLVAVAVLRAGLGLLDAVVDMLPEVKVGYLGVARDEETAQPTEYYTKLPDLSNALVMILEPMLATGGSLSWAIGRVKELGATDITALCVVAAPAGIERIEEDHPETRLVVGAVDAGLNHKFYIRPGLGDMGDRLFGTF